MRKFTIQCLLCITILFGLLPLQLKAQELFLNPSGTVFQLSSDIPEYKLPTFNIDQMLREDSINIENNITPFRFAKKFDVNINPQNSGKWETVDDIKIWRCKISSANAFSMMAIFENLNLPDSSSLFIYNENMTQIAGPFQSAFNQDVILPTELIAGASIIVELVVNVSDQQELPYFTITSVSHDYWNLIDILNGNEKGKLAGKILKCHNDINCSEGDNWQTHKRAVAMIVVDGSALCTGSNINNTNFDGTPYFLTANHCYNGNTNVISRSVFYYNYEKEGCGGKKERPYYTISGATLISNNSYSDFTLLRINGGRVPSSYYPYFAGWDKTGNNLANATVIHHPAGNVKKISFDNGNVAPNTITKLMFAPNTAWEVSYNSGTTEGGSSGSPLFNQNGKIVGQLGGGESGCDITDWYGRLSVSWNHGSTASTRLKEWLDPNNSNPNEILGFIPEGWRNDWLTGWNQPSAHKTHPQVK